MSSNKPSSNPVDFIAVDALCAGQRLDNFLMSRLKGVPRSHVYRIVRRGEVRVNAGRAGPDYRLQAGDLVRIPPLRIAPRAPREQAVPSSVRRLAKAVLYEDEHLLVLDKPQGVAVHGGSRIAVGAIEGLRRLRPAQPYLELAHRLDRATSGCLLFAKDRATLRRLHSALRDPSGRGIEKTYLALVRGPWRGGARRVSAALGRQPAGCVGQRLAEVTDGGRPALSEFQAERRFPGCTLVRIRLVTGRTHQARAHAAHIGHPIAGDRKYGDPAFNRELKELGLGRMFLHAARLRFQHPVSDEPLAVEAPLPPELQGVLARLPNRWGDSSSIFHRERAEKDFGEEL